MLAKISADRLVTITRSENRGREAGSDQLIENERKEMNVVLNVPEDLPQIRADFDKITQVLNNLVDNAFNYTYTGGTITIGAKQDGPSIVISISDTGIGSHETKRDRLFHAFEQGDGGFDDGAVDVGEHGDTFQG